MMDSVLRSGDRVYVTDSVMNVDAATGKFGWWRSGARVGSVRFDEPVENNYSTSDVLWSVESDAVQKYADGPGSYEMLMQRLDTEYSVGDEIRLGYVYYVGDAGGALARVMDPSPNADLQFGPQVRVRVLSNPNDIPGLSVGTQVYVSKSQILGVEASASAAETPAVEASGVEFDGDQIRKHVMTHAKKNAWCPQAREALKDLELNPDQRMKIDVQLTVSIVADVRFCPWAENDAQAQEWLTEQIREFGVHDGKLSFNPPGVDGQDGYPISKLYTSTVSGVTVTSVEMKD